MPHHATTAELCVQEPRCIGLISLLALLFVKPSLAYSRPSASCELQLSTLDQLGCKWPNFQACAAAYHVEVNTTDISLTALQSEAPDECRFAKGRFGAPIRVP